MITYTCACGTVLSIPDEYAGQTGKCNKCNTSITVPLSNAAVVQGNGDGGSHSQAPHAQIHHMSDARHESRVAGDVGQYEAITEETLYVGFWRRVVAYLLDTCFMTIPMAILLIVIWPFTKGFGEAILDDVSPADRPALSFLIVLVAIQPIVFAFRWIYGSSGFTVRFMNSHPTNWYLDSCSA